MVALSKNKAASNEYWNEKRFILAAGMIAFVNAAAVIDLATGEVQPASGANGEFPLGFFTQNVDATSGARSVNVRLPRELKVEWLENGSSITAADVGKVAFYEDDQTVTLLPTGSIAGRVWAVSARDGVAVELLANPPGVSPDVALPAFVAGALALSRVAPGAIHVIPATAGASTVTLPADPPDGIEATFVADGAANGHTVTYRDGDGPTNLTTALTASQRHVVRVISAGGSWHASAYISPA